ncbi:MAG: WbqC family protein [Bacteroidota bacterium]
MSSYNTKRLLIELHYFPCIEYFTCLHEYDVILIEAQENYIKQSFRNRCYIKDANGKLQLTVPVIGGRKKISVKDIQIDHDQNWNQIHLRALRSAYGKAPFFEYYFDYFEKAFQKREKFLFDFNRNLLTVCLQVLGINKNILITKTYTKGSQKNYSDLRNQISAKSDFANRTFYQAVEYYQVFGKDFAPNLSVVDLIMNEGPNSAAIIQQSAY